MSRGELTLDAGVDVMHEVAEPFLVFDSFSSLTLFKLFRLELGATKVYLTTGADVSMALVIGLLTVLANVVGLMHWTMLL